MSDDEARRRALEELADRTPVPLERTAELAGDSSGVLLIAEMLQGFRVVNEASVETEAPALFVWGGLRATRFLGEGSYGEVYAAWDPALHREVALKLRRASARGLGSSTLRWLDEARNLARVRHPNVLTIHGANLHDNRAGMWTELVHGQTLEHVVRAKGTLAPRDVARIGRDVCAALAAVHAAGLVHGDVKPSNVMLDESVAAGAEPRVVLMDFGSAHTQSLEETPLAVPSLGTPLAMAPEVVRGAAVTPAADLYSVGVLLFRLLTARFPVEAATLEDLASAHERGHALALGELRDDLPAPLAALIARALSRDPASRPASAEAMRRSLAEIADPQTWVQRWGRALAVVCVVAAATGGILAAWATWGQGPDENTFTSQPVPAATQPGLLRLAREYDGKQYNELYGTSLSSVGDLAGDGRDAFFIGIGGHSNPQQGAGRGEIHTLRGADGRDTLIWSGEGDGSNFGFGSRVALAKDIDGDGLPDLLVGVGGATDSSFATVGQLRVFRGIPGGFSARPSQVLVGPAAGWGFCGSLAAVGDVDGDGYADVLIGASRASRSHEHEGMAALYRGGPHGLETSPSWTRFGDMDRAGCGYAVGAVGDVNGDGYADFAVTSVWEAQPALESGMVEIFLGGPHGPSPKPALVLHGTGEAAHLGNIIVPLGDINGDGVDDFAVGEVGLTGDRFNQGRALVFLGSRGRLSDRPYWALAGDCSNAEMGSCIACPGDVDGDGVPDLLVGEGEYRDHRGTHGRQVVMLFSGKHLGEHAPPLWTYTAPAGSQSWPQWLAGAGDVDGDGRGDLLVGAISEHQGADGAGAVRLFTTGGPRRPRSPERWPRLAGMVRR